MEITRGSKFFLNAIAKDIKGQALDYGSKNGEIAEQMGCSFADHNITNKTDVEQTFYVSDIVEIELKYNTVILTAKYSSELNKMLIEEIMESLPSNGTLYIILSKNYSLDSLDSLPWKLNLAVEDKEFRIIKLVKVSHFIADENKYLHDFPVEILNHKINLITDPSIFSNKVLDTGTRALLEKVELHTGPLLDIGCGSGIIGILSSKILDAKVTMLDVNLRALKWARINAEKNNVCDVEILPNHGLNELGRRGFYQTILSNPPYHTDYSVSKEFIEEGYKMLKMGGSMWFVVKNPAWYLKKFASVFGGVRLIEHHGYAIVHAEKRPMEKKEKPKKTTKKHQKRMESRKKKRT